MFYLLRHTTLLFELPNNCYMQLTGTPLKPLLNKKFRRYFVEPSRQHLPRSLRLLISRLQYKTNQSDRNENNNQQRRQQIKNDSSLEMRKRRRMIRRRRVSSHPTLEERPQSDLLSTNTTNIVIGSISPHSKKSSDSLNIDQHQSRVDTTTSFLTSNRSLNLSNTSILTTINNKEHELLKRNEQTRGTTRLHTSLTSLPSISNNKHIELQRSSSSSDLNKAKAKEKITSSSPSSAPFSKLEFKEIPRFKIFYANIHNRQRGLPRSRISHPHSYTTLL
jgi:hypothetical protein